jgi:hypothetical protein
MYLAIENIYVAAANLEKGTSHAAMGYKPQSAIWEGPTDFLGLPPTQRTDKSWCKVNSRAITGFSTRWEFHLSLDAIFMRWQGDLQSQL